MDGRISFDVYAVMRDPHFRVDEHEGNRIDVTFGGPPGPELHESMNVLQLWFTEPKTVIDLGRELYYRGVRWEEVRNPTGPDDNEGESDG